MNVPRRRKPLVLIADSEADTRALYGNWFWSVGFDVMTAGVLDAVYQFAKRHQPDLLMTDLHLQGRTVLPAIRQLQNDAETRDIPILVVTRSTEPMQLDTAKQTGATAVLPKLASFDALLDSVIPLVSLRLNVRHGSFSSC